MEVAQWESLKEFKGRHFADLDENFVLPDGAAGTLQAKSLKEIQARDFADLEY